MGEQMRSGLGPPPDSTGSETIRKAPEERQDVARVRAALDDQLVPSPSFFEPRRRLAARREEVVSPRPNRAPTAAEIRRRAWWRGRAGWKAQRLSQKVLVRCSVCTDPTYFVKFGAHRAPYKTAIEGSGTDSQAIASGHARSRNSHPRPPRCLMATVRQSVAGLARRSPERRRFESVETGHKRPPRGVLVLHSSIRHPTIGPVVILWEAVRCRGQTGRMTLPSEVIRDRDAREETVDPTSRMMRESNDVTNVVPSSPTRTRTLNLAVNSRSLYRLSYRGIHSPEHNLATGPTQGDSIRRKCDEGARRCGTGSNGEGPAE